MTHASAGLIVFDPMPLLHNDIAANTDVAEAVSVTRCSAACSRG